ncbi:MAG TPA: hypothetical protein VKB47_11660 [Terracidiphilus sp.]|nr:hypothetical protein [Terracidiphilus sp.]
MSRRSPEVISADLAMVPGVTGIIGLFGISDPLYASARLLPTRSLTAIFVSSAASGSGLVLPCCG